ncbi:MAG TPA: hypothetical protein VIL12_00850 [Acidimicrobiia bacterium]
MRRVLIGIASGLVLLAGGLAAAALFASPFSAAAQESEDETATEDVDRPFLLRAEEFIDDALAPLVEEGVINADQAESVKQALLEKAETLKAEGRDHLMRLRHRGRHLIGFGLQTAADAIGIETDELAAAIRDGQSIAEVAEANGVDPQVVIDALVDAASARIDEAAAEHDLDEERVDQLKARLPELAEMIVNGEFPALHGLGGRIFPWFPGFNPPAGASA